MRRNGLIDISFMRIKYFIVLYLFANCNSSHSQSIFEKNIYLKDGHIIKQKYDKGVLLSEEECIKTLSGLILDGTTKNYYNTGITKSIYDYKNGELDGFASNFWYNGKLFTRKHYKNNHLVGSEIQYDHSGNLDFYKFTYYNDSNDYYFGVVYKNNGAIDTIMGNPILLYADVGTDKSNPVDVLTYFIAMPPKIKVEFVYSYNYKVMHNYKISNFKYDDSLDMHYFNAIILDENSYIGKVQLYDSVSNKLLYSYPVTYKPHSSITYKQHNNK